jgi:hypothetical protein
VQPSIDTARAGLLAALVALAAAAGAPARAQDLATLEQDPFAVSEPIAEIGDTAAAIEIRLAERRRLDVPGPLPGAGPRVRGAEIRLAVAGGEAVLALVGEPALRIENAAGDLPADDGWVVAADGAFRARAVPGRVEAERRCRKCRTGWKRDWRLRLAGSLPSRPLVTADRVFVGAFDNRVYALRRGNGHRVWDTDVGGRVSTALSWRPSSPGAEGAPVPDLVVAIPDDGSKVAALDAVSGRIAATASPPVDAWFVPPAVVTGDGQIVVALQHYELSAASMLVLAVEDGAVPVVARTTPPPGE